MCHCCQVEKKKEKGRTRKNGHWGKIEGFHLVANSLVAEGRYADAPLFVPALFILLCYL